MDANLEQLYNRVMDAKYPEDVYSSEDIVLPEKFLLEYLAKRQEKLLASCDPQSYSNPLDVDCANEVRDRLSSFYKEAQSRIHAGHYGLSGFGRPLARSMTKSFVVGNRRYFLDTKLEDSGWHSIYRGFLESNQVMLGEVSILLANDTTSNYLLDQEARNVHLLHALDVPQWKHLPFILDSFRAGQRMGLVQRGVLGPSLETVRSHFLYSKGIDQKHMVWILDRILSCLGYVHSQGLVHGELTPNQVLISPESHNCVLRGWHNAMLKPAQTGERSMPEANCFIAPEVIEQGEVGPWSDIYSLGKLMIWTLGGDPEFDIIPEEVEWPIRDFLLKLVKESPFSRPSDAWELHREQNAIKDSLWERKFIPFVWS